MTTLLLSALLACTGQTLECSESSMISVFADEDRDGFGDDAQQKLVCEVGAKQATIGGDCDDTRSSVNPGGFEECDGLDNDCDGDVDEDLREVTYYADADSDGFGDATDTILACTPPPGYVDNPSDCWDNDALSNPAADEFCDGKDNDCNGLADDDDPLTDIETMPIWYFDGDADGYGDPEKFIQACEAPFPNVVDNGDDCDDSDPDRHPGAGEVCNMVDDDCDGHLDDSDADIDPASLTTYYYDGDADGAGDPNVSVDACDEPWFHVQNDTDCDDTEPMLQDASTGFWVLDADGDGYGAMGTPVSGPTCTPPSANHVLQFYATDCDDGNPLNYPGGDEICDGIDNDCDLLVDDADDTVDLTTATTWFLDTDADGFGDPDATIDACAVPAGATADDTDCDDLLAEVNPDATEICNGNIDDDCDGLKDEADPSLDLASIITWYFDFDEDGWGDPGISIDSCSKPAGYVDNDLDCDDNDDQSGAFISWLADADADGFGAGAPSGPSCAPPAPNGWVPEGDDLDCDDGDAGSFPGAEEICDDTVDQDCDGVDESCNSDVPDTCAEALVAPRYTTGLHVLGGDLSGFANDINWTTSNACTGKTTAGGEAMVPVTVAAGEALYASYSNGLDASMYLVPTCTAPSPASCNIGSDGTPTAGATENIWYHNTGLAPIDLYLVLDCAGSCSTYDLILDIASPVSFFTPDTCVDAQGAEPMITGAYGVSGKIINAMTNNMQLGVGGCTTFAAAGREGFFPVELLAGEKINVSYLQLVDDASTYLLTDCTNGASCVIGEDGLGNAGLEKMGHTNNTGATQTLYLGVDCFGAACSDYELNVTIE